MIVVYMALHPCGNTMRAKISVLRTRGGYIPLRASRRTNEELWSKYFDASTGGTQEAITEALFESLNHTVEEPWIMPCFSIPPASEPILRRVIFESVPRDYYWERQEDGRVYDPTIDAATVACLPAYKLMRGGREP